MTKQFFEVVDLQQGTDEWKEWRTAGVTATDAVVLAGASPYKTRWRLWAEKTGYCSEVDLSRNPLVKRGHEQEDVARQAAEAYFDDLLIPVCIQSKMWPWLRASLDGINSLDEPVELKNPSERVWNAVKTEKENSEAYKMYRIQVLHQMLVLGATRGWLVFHRDGEIEVFEIAAEMQQMGQMLRDSVELVRQVRERDEPEKNELEDWYIPKGSDAETWVALSQSYRTLDAQAAELKEKLKLINERQKAISEQLQGMMGSFRSADYCGVQITRYAVAKTDYKQMLADGVFSEDDANRYTTDSDRCRVTVNPESAMPKFVKDSDAVAPLQEVASSLSAGF